jgi:hypothetical protein
MHVYKCVRVRLFVSNSLSVCVCVCVCTAENDALVLPECCRLE